MKGKGESLSDCKEGIWKNILKTIFISNKDFLVTAKKKMP